MQVYKSAGANSEYIIMLEIGLKPDENNLTRSGVRNADYAKFRCKTARVVKIENKETGETIDKVASWWDPHFIYRVNETLSEPNYDTNQERINSKGIHFFKTRDAALHYNLDNDDMNFGDYMLDSNGGKYGHTTTLPSGERITWLRGTCCPQERPRQFC